MDHRGEQALWIPIGATLPTITAGASAIQQFEQTVGRPNQIFRDFDSTQDEAVEFSIIFGTSWDAGTVNFQAVWQSAGAVSTGITVGLEGVCIADGEASDAVYGTAIFVDDDAQNTAYEQFTTVKSNAVTIGGTPAFGEKCTFRFYRDFDATNDDMTQDMRVEGIWFFYTTDTPNDE